MKHRHCYKCERKTRYKPKTGIGSWILIVLTLGLWVVVIKLFYRNRCSACGLTRRQANKIAFPAEYWAPLALMLSMLFMAGVLWLALS
ncbi:MAG: hypothetical protein CO187_01230 [Zetaproteobacteria bacterium CG_4_9_14_3_um_filter_53_7]|nr:MAG: hypothetical protein CO187_01230 [Zetaproteobacteria bacterium CG_4_9_14_3_um_filter_53_7]